MPKTPWRVVSIHPETGEVRCNDPSCNVTQCGQCNVEQNKRKREAKKREREANAAAEKERQQEAERAAVRQAIVNGRTFEWTYDAAERQETHELQPAVVVDHNDFAKNAFDLSSSDEDFQRAPKTITQRTCIIAPKNAKKAPRVASLAPALADVSTREHELQAALVIVERNAHARKVDEVNDSDEEFERTKRTSGGAVICTRKGREKGLL
jgi:hypothetical protein